MNNKFLVFVQPITPIDGKWDITQCLPVWLSFGQLIKCEDSNWLRFQQDENGTSCRFISLTGITYILGNADFVVEEREQQQ